MSENKKTASAYNGQLKPITEGIMKGNIKNIVSSSAKPNTPPPPQPASKK